MEQSSIHLPPGTLPLVVVLGAGFAGIDVVRHLPQDACRVLLIDRNNYHTFQPLLYQVAIGGLEPDSVAYPVRKIFSGRREFYFRMADILHVDLDNKRIETSLGVISFDYLVVATGSRTNFFGMDDVRRHALTLKSVTDALDLRSLLLQNLEAALQRDDPSEKSALLTMVVAGGGPTGLETAGSLAELKRHVFLRDYPELDLNIMQIWLVESGPELLAAMSPQARRGAAGFIRQLGVNVRLDAAVKSYDGLSLTLSTGDKISARTLIWAAGVTGNLPPGIPEKLIEKNRVRTDAFLRVEGYENVFAIGDCAAVLAAGPKGYPMLAPVAKQQGKLLGRNIAHLLQGQKLKPFVYFDKGTMATVGRARAVMDLGRLHLRGWFAWLGWLFVHLMYLVGFRNKVIVLVNWFWNYIRYDSAIRLIIRPFRRNED